MNEAQPRLSLPAIISGECPHTAEKTNSPLKELKWVRDGVCINTGGQIGRQCLTSTAE